MIRKRISAAEAATLRAIREREEKHDREARPLAERLAEVLNADEFERLRAYVDAVLDEAMQEALEPEVLDG